jgi:hypothetical protein
MGRAWRVSLAYRLSPFLRASLNFYAVGRQNMQKVEQKDLATSIRITCKLELHPQLRDLSSRYEEVIGEGGVVVTTEG